MKKRKLGTPRRRRTSRPRKRKQVTIEQLTTLTGTEYHQLDNGVTFKLEDVMTDRLTSYGNLLQKFYTINEDQQPLVWLLQEDRAQAISEKLWLGVFRGSFHVRIILNHHDKTGPHRCELWFQTFSLPKKNHWIASLQLMAFYYNENEMKTALLEAIAKREFYILPRNRDIPIMP